MIVPLILVTIPLVLVFYLLFVFRESSPTRRTRGRSGKTLTTRQSRKPSATSKRTDTFKEEKSSDGTSPRGQNTTNTKHDRRLNASVKLDDIELKVLPVEHSVPKYNYDYELPSQAVLNRALESLKRCESEKNNRRRSSTRSDSSAKAKLIRRQLRECKPHGSIRYLRKKFPSATSKQLSDTAEGIAAIRSRLREETTDTLDLFPAWRLVSFAADEDQETWKGRWLAAGESVEWKDAIKDQFVARKDSPIWQALGNGVGGYEHTAIGNPYPPFTLDSLMSWVDMDRDEARRAGLDI